MSRRALKHLPVAGIRRRIDYFGAVLLVVGLTALLIPITRIGQGVAWNDLHNLGLFALAVVILGVCLLHETRTPEPIIPINLFRMPVVAMCCGILFLCFFQLVSLASLSPLRFQMVAGVTADNAAWRLLPLTFMIPLGAFISGRVMLQDRAAPGRSRSSAPRCVPFGLVGLAFVSPVHAIGTGVLMTWVGLSIGVVMPSSLVAVQNAVPRAQLGVATAGTAFSRSLGGAIGVALLSAILLASLHGTGGPMLRACAGRTRCDLAPGGSRAAVGDVGRRGRTAFQHLFLSSPRRSRRSRSCSRCASPTAGSTGRRRPEPPMPAFAPAFRRPCDAARVPLSCSRRRGRVAPPRTLSIGLSSDVTSIDPQWNNSGPNVSLSTHVFEPLTLTDRNGRLVPGLATSWRAVDPLTWEFKLRPGVEFHDGSELTADDVVFSIERPKTLQGSPASFASFVRPIVEVTAVDS